MSETLILCIVLLALLAEYMDSTLGMGYGTTLTPVLLLMGFEPLDVVPAILISELFTGLAAGFTHHRVGNVDFSSGTIRIGSILRNIRQMGLRSGLNGSLPVDLRIAMVLSACSILGTVVAVFIAVTLPKHLLKLYIGVLITVIGLLILLTIRRVLAFSWTRVVALGMLASFNKGLSGGGYGPVVTGGQILAGVTAGRAVGITSLSEGVTCGVGVLVYLMTGCEIHLPLALSLTGGALLSVVPSAWTVHRINGQVLRTTIGIVVLVLGALSVWNVLF